MPDIAETEQRRDPAPRRRWWKWVRRIALAGFLAAGVFVWWWNYSGSLLPLTARVENGAGVFTLAAPVPVVRTEAGGAACAGRMYVVGGIGAFAETLTSVQAYDPAEDRWETLPDLPRPLSHSGVVDVDGRLWVVGGFGPLGLRLRGFMFARWDPVTCVWVYDPGAGTWTEGPSLPLPRGAGGIAWDGAHLWYAGGIDETLKVTDTVFRLDPATGRWETMPPLGIARDHLRMEALDGRLYALSGRKDDLRHNLDAVECFDPERGEWRPVAPIPKPRGGFASIPFGGYLYTFGGEDVWTCHDGIERYDPRADRWETVGSLPEARHGICAGVIDGRVHLVTGGRHPRVSVSGIHRVFEPAGPR